MTVTITNLAEVNKITLKNKLSSLCVIYRKKK